MGTTGLRSVLYGLVVLGASCLAQDVSWVRLDELDLSKATIGWGSIGRNQSVEKKPLTIAGVLYEYGVGTHADSQMNIKLSGAGQTFEALVGIDDEVIASEEGKKQASVEFVVLGDNKPLYKSKVMKAGDAAEAVKLDIKNVELLCLTVRCGQDTNYDHADWAMAKLSYAGTKPEMVDPVMPTPYILTPKAGPEPRITGPKVFGVRPGSPFLFTVTATGERPMKFELKGAPEGLTLDATTGQIRGAVKTVGDYKTTVIAENKLGKAEREFKIVVGDTICLTPPMGWNSWNCWACAVDDAKVRASAKAMVDSGLINHGWSYINIDDCWMRKAGTQDPVVGEPVRDKDGYLVSNAKFPDMKALTDYVHSLGLRAGLYISPGPTTCQGYVGSWEHEQKDAEKFAEWGFDYLKYDWCGYSSVVRNPNLDELKKPYSLMGEKLRAVGRDIVYSLCQYGMGDVWKWGGETGGNCWRTTGDITDSWSSMSGIGFKQAELYPYAKPGNWNDPDMLVIGKVGWGPSLHPARLTPDEQYTHISLWCLLSAPLLIGCPIEQLDDFTMNLLTNDEVLEVNQDPLGQQARRIVQNNGLEVWTKAMEDGSRAVGLFNLGEWEPKKVTVEWKDIAFVGQCRVRDLWRQKDLGTFGDRFGTEVPPHGVVLIRVFPAR